MHYIGLLSLILLPVPGLAAPAPAPAPVPGEWIVGQQVNTTSGRVRGHSSPWKPLVSEYLGVRYAKPPTGPLRFAPPEPFLSDDPVDAATFSNSCPSVNLNPENQTLGYGSPRETHYGGLRQLGETFGEDCLALNVWARPQSGESKKAVLVWIHGGSFTGGSSTWPLHHGARLADEHDVVVVSLNYRLTIFGFPLAESFEVANLGLLDMRLAIEWVRDNIEHFGGDSSRITLVGQSAGAGAIDNYALIYPDDPIAHAIITQSGISIGASGCRRWEDTEPQRELSRYMSKAWTDFAKEPLKALPRLGWQLAAVSFPRLGGDNSSAIVFENSTRLAVGCEAILGDFL